MPREPRQVVLEAQDLLVQQGTFALRIPHWTLASGECVGLLGANGAGKTTLLRALSGRRAPVSGQVQLLGRPLQRWQASVSTMLALAPDRLEGPAHLTVMQHLRLRARWFRSWDATYADTLLDRLAVPRATRLGDLSRGNQAKLGFIACEAYRPPVLLLDEPTAGLDPLVRADLRAVLSDALSASPSRAIVFSTHVVEDLADLADRVVTVHGGTLRGDFLLDSPRGGFKRHRRLQDMVTDLRTPETAAALGRDAP